MQGEALRRGEPPTECGTAGDTIHPGNATPAQAAWGPWPRPALESAAATRLQAALRTPPPPANPEQQQATRGDAGMRGGPTVITMWQGHRAPKSGRPTHQVMWPRDRRGGARGPEPYGQRARGVPWVIAGKPRRRRPRRRRRAAAYLAARLAPLGLGQGAPPCGPPAGRGNPSQRGPPPLVGPWGVPEHNVDHVAMHLPVAVRWGWAGPGWGRGGADS
jgi:hypothetical protein